MPKACKLLILYQEQLQGHLLTFRTTGSDARRLNLNRVCSRELRDFYLFLQMGRKIPPDLAVVFPHPRLVTNQLTCSLAMNMPFSSDLPGQPKTCPWLCH